ncbi:MAG: GntR family transcriptional regulator [Acidobacteriota bacterium]
MIRTLQIDPSDAVPIWKQIEEGIQRLVVSGILTAGAPVPSVRDLAKELRVNPATVAKAYQHLVDAGVLSVKRGEGTFVADTPPSMAKSERRRLLREAAMRYAIMAASIGATSIEALEELKAAMAMTHFNTTNLPATKNRK